MIKTMKSNEDLWTIRKQFTSQMAAVSFMTYIMSICQRHPHKFMISRNTGKLYTTEVLPSKLLTILTILTITIFIVLILTLLIIFLIIRFTLDTTSIV